MSSKILKISMIAATVAASFNAGAAIYNVYAYDPVDSNSETWGSAIQQSNVDCWGADDCAVTHDADHKIAFEEQRFQQGFEYRLEAPFLIENGFEYLEDDRDGFDSYCRRYLDYADSLCDTWASRQYSQGYAREEGGDIENSSAYVETNKVGSSTNNVVINNFNDSGEVVGSYQESLSERTRGFESSTDNAFAGGDRSQAFAQQGNLTVGSVSTKSTRYGTDYTSKATVWDGNTQHTIGWSGASETSRSMPQGSARDLANINGTDYAVGYNSDSDELPVAAVFNLSDLNSITTTLVYPGGKSDYEDNFLNSLLTSVNDQGVAIGTAKYRTGNDGSINDRLFYVGDVTNNPSASWVSGGVFFTSANAKAGAINNHDEVVGQVDREKHQETNNGKPRAKAAFIASLSGSSKAPIGGSSRYLDDLTYGSNGLASNNDYRVIDATDINDASVISGTAYYCAGGFDSAAIDASCSAGAKLVAVKLVPINGTDESNISARPQETSKVERNGAGFGIIALTLLGFIGFRRK
ncbi:DUF3466 family protein [Vibrio sinaloensis]|uniref:DUF3466 family protein n=1 Tax=Photobacterium sp. (strain ATCC 43367) TaxID=379097 RepID=UPI0035ED7151